MKNVVVIDYFSGNIFSITRALEALGCRVTLANAPEDIRAADYCVLPGVGAFGDGISTLKQKKLPAAISDFIKKGKPFLGICLGMQLLFSSSEEFGFHSGLNLVKGKVSKLPDHLGLKVPNIGWHPLILPKGKPQTYWDGTILKDLKPENDLYFVHSFAAYPENQDDWLAATSYGSHTFCSVVKKENVVGCQFHPEKSGPGGLMILKNFLDI